MKKQTTTDNDRQCEVYLQESDALATRANRILNRLGRYPEGQQRRMQGVAYDLMRQSERLMRRAERMAR